jgi:hypothetical protein
MSFFGIEKEQDFEDSLPIPIEELEAALLEIDQ